MRKNKHLMLAAILWLGGATALLAQSADTGGTARPKVSIDNLKGTVTKEVPVEGTFTISYTNPSTGRAREERYRCMVSHRGATSLRFDKKSLKIVFLQDEEDKERDVSLPVIERTDDKYNLDAAAVDRSHFRNRLCMDLFNSYSRLPYDTIQNGRHGIVGNYVEVWMEGEYSGLFCLTDRVNRKLLGVKKMKNGQVRGVVYKCKSFGNGCFIAPDGTEPTDSTYSWNAWEVKYPNEYPVEVWKPLQELMNAPWESEPHATYVDLVRQHFYWDNLVDLYLLTLVAGVADMGYKNSYLSCRNYTADQRFVITPWDMDYSFGATYNGVPLMDLSTLMGQSNWSKARPFKRLLQNTDFGFLAALANRWAALRDGPLSVERVSQLMYSYADLFDQSGVWQREREAWNYNPVTLGTTAREEAEYMAEWYSANHQQLDELLTPYQTGIKEVVQQKETDGMADNNVYDLQGRKVSTEAKKGIQERRLPSSIRERGRLGGIYITGNKKIIIK